MALEDLPAVLVGLAGPTEFESCKVEAEIEATTT
jgi:hypothetical protein